VQTRPLPEINWNNLRPPYDWWDFYRDADRHAFRFDASGFDILNAWWLIEASTLVYSNPAFVQDTFAHVGLPRVQFFDGISTQCFVADNNEFIIVAFRGTEMRLRRESPDLMDIVYDLLTDAEIRLKPQECGGCVHQGFQEALAEVWQDSNRKGNRDTCLKSYLDKLLAQKKRPIWFTGHSLGAALATLAANLYGNCQGLYTFGSPRVGDLEFRNRFRPTNYRFVNSNDIVTRVPPEGLYQHVGILKFIGADGNVQHETTSCSPLDFSQDTINNILESAQKLKPDTLLRIPDWLLNHVPLLYSTHIWNEYAQNE
jgi:triacylglycerol lipase